VKLLDKTILILVSYALGIVFLSSAGVYALLHYITDRDIESRLSAYEAQVRARPGTYIGSGPVAWGDERLFISESERPKGPAHLSDTAIQDHEGGYHTFRKKSFSLSHEGKAYHFELLISLENKSELIRIIIVLMVIVSMTWVLSTLVFNLVSFRRVWADFYKAVEAIRDFNIDSGQTIHLGASDIQEFDLLNRALSRMTGRISKDYALMKRFTENMSHEFQTPLAILRGKTELLFQQGSLDERALKMLKAIYDNVNRLSRLHSTLVLLHKIENRQFPETHRLNLHEVLNNKLEVFAEMAKAKGLSIHKTINDMQVQMNAELAGILISNLVKNAIRHNWEGGRIEIELSGGCMAISNTGEKKALDKAVMYERFAHKSPDGMGLGLSLVKEICGLYGIAISYSYEEGLHRFLLRFPSVLV
jgi:signal transduction histidine kinase